MTQITTSASQVKVGDKLYFAPRGKRPGIFRKVTFIRECGLSREFHFDPGNTSLRSGREVVLVERPSEQDQDDNDDAMADSIARHGRAIEANPGY